MTAPYESLPVATRDSLLRGYLAGAWRGSPQQPTDYPHLSACAVGDETAYENGRLLRSAAHMVWTADGIGDYGRDRAQYDAIATRLNATYVQRMVILTTDRDRPCGALGLRGFRVVPVLQRVRPLPDGSVESTDCLALAEDADARDRYP